MSTAEPSTQNTLQQLRDNIDPGLLNHLFDINEQGLKPNNDEDYLPVAITIGVYKDTARGNDDREAWAFFYAKPPRVGATPIMQIFIFDPNTRTYTSSPVRSDRLDQQLKLIALDEEFYACTNSKDVVTTAKYYMLLLAERSPERLAEHNIPFNNTFKNHLVRMCEKFRDVAPELAELRRQREREDDVEASVSPPSIEVGCRRETAEKPARGASGEEEEIPGSSSPIAESPLSSVGDISKSSEAASDSEGRTTSGSAEDQDKFSSPGRILPSTIRSTQHTVVSSLISSSSTSSSESLPAPVSLDQSALQEEERNREQFYQNSRATLSRWKKNHQIVQAKIRELERKRKRTEDVDERVVQYRRLSNIVEGNTETVSRHIEQCEKQTKKKKQ
ncbi:hypothetical protein N0V94_005589 [Neodidymelliopsis sp. IMI 364377]|nr:hypothetical protein N0V94_005589 [Neodidymelliopsis sp. IMI 364377]